MPTKKQTFKVGRGVAAYAHLDKPDTKVPANATFKADNKYKVTLILDDEAPCANLRAAIIEAAREKWGSKFVESDFNFPFKHHPDDHKNEAFQGKVTLLAKSGDKYKPKLVDSKKKDLPPSVKIFGGDIINIVVTFALYEKTEKVKVGGKYVDETLRGSNLYLSAVQLIEKRSGGGGVDAFDEEDGYEADGDTDAPAGDADNGDF